MKKIINDLIGICVIMLILITALHCNKENPPSVNAGFTIKVNDTVKTVVNVGDLVTFNLNNPSQTELFTFFYRRFNLCLSCRLHT